MDRAEMVRRGAEAAWRVDWPGAEWEFASVSAEDREWYGKVAEAVLGAARPATAREHLDAAWEAAHTPEDGMIPAETAYLVRFSPGNYSVRKTGAEPISAESAFTRRLLVPPAPGPAEQLRALLVAYRDQDADADDYEGRLSVYLARHGARVGEDW